LFTADQQLKGDTAIYTRQNAAGTRRGLEVPEERDYFPYWGPTPWKDIAIMVSDKKTEDLMKQYVNSPHYGHKREVFFFVFFPMSLPLFVIMYAVLLVCLRNGPLEQKRRTKNGPYPAVLTLHLTYIPYALKILFPAANHKTCL